MIFIHQIQRAVAEQHGLPVEVMTSDSRIRDHARPRHMAMTISTVLTKHSKVRIGQLFGGRDHSTVIHAERETLKRCVDPKVRSAMRQVAHRLLLEEAGQ